MENMMVSVQEITGKLVIGNVIKVIDDIAFQTNILGAERGRGGRPAGQHGKGFAVVAEEVRQSCQQERQCGQGDGGADLHQY
jgi:methyl-accepting chemotaxis protein